jgi:hypothetical protein
MSRILCPFAPDEGERAAASCSECGYRSECLDWALEYDAALGRAAGVTKSEGRELIDRRDELLRAIFEEEISEAEEAKRRLAVWESLSSSI